MTSGPIETHRECESYREAERKRKTSYSSLDSLNYFTFTTRSLEPTAHYGVQRREERLSRGILAIKYGISPSSLVTAQCIMGDATRLDGWTLL
ncbi:hypothetical protein ALC62_12223 [Cyphomyrmex costatus]|uniref:Uncharacterized protein n=1 Tax=Cyphomyrmex costatus TaxID=456900 RepID=A0A195C8T7_9HYME|nr:hypothetical protein ALC62_12223 [Cyphomyrmex costatus]